MPDSLRARRSARRRRGVALAAALLGFGPPAAAGELPAGYEDLERRIIEIAERIKPSVVHIEAIIKRNDRRNQVTGSGVIASADGRVLTNHHVVDKAEKITVSVPGRKKKYAARLVGTDKQTDIALLRIQPDTPFPAATFGSAAEVRVGQWVLAIGNPYGLDGTVSFGIVSAKGRNLEIPDVLNDFIQTDAMIDRGSSGGPLVDLDGRVVGINSRGQGRGIGFTIPIDTALEVMEQLERGGIERGYLGVSIQPLDRELADYFGLPDTAGVVVNSVAEDSPADRAGLRPGDILTHLDGNPIEAEREEDLGIFQRVVASVAPRAEAKLDFVRDGKIHRAEIVMGTQPKVDPAEEESEVGFHVQEITANLQRKQRLHSDRGAYVYFVARGSPAAEAGLRVGDVVERVEEARVRDLADFRRAMERIAGKSRFLITARRGEEMKFLLVRRGAQPAAPEEPEGDAEQASQREGTE